MFETTTSAIIYAAIITSGTMIILLLLLAMLHNGLAVNEYEEFEKHLLTKLGLKRRPVIDGPVKIPPATMDLYKSMLKENMMTTNFPLPGSHTRSANTVRTYTNQGSAPINSKSQKYRLQFQIDLLPEQEQVKAAEIRFTMVDNTLRERDEFIHVLVHDIIKPGVKGLSKPILRLVDSKSIELSKTLKSNTTTFDVTPVLERLSETNFEENHGLLVQCVTTSGSRTNLLDVFDFETSESTLLMVYTDDGTSKKSTLADTIRERHKRSADGSTGTHKKPKRSLCQRHSMYVDFKEVGFENWIIAPPGYEAYHCHGMCPFPMPTHLNATNHAVLQTLMHTVYQNVPPACCVPTKLGMLSMLYLELDGKVVLKNYPEMTADECGCL